MSKVLVNQEHNIRINIEDGMKAPALAAKTKEAGHGLGLESVKKLMYGRAETAAGWSIEETDNDSNKNQNTASNDTQSTASNSDTDGRKNLDGSPDGRVNNGHNSHGEHGGASEGQNNTGHQNRSEDGTLLKQDGTPDGRANNVAPNQDTGAHQSEHTGNHQEQPKKVQLSIVAGDSPKIDVVIEQTQDGPKVEVHTNGTHTHEAGATDSTNQMHNTASDSGADTDGRKNLDGTPDGRQNNGHNSHGENSGQGQNNTGHQNRSEDGTLLKQDGTPDARQNNVAPNQNDSQDNGQQTETNQGQNNTGHQNRSEDGTLIKQDGTPDGRANNVAPNQNQTNQNQGAAPKTDGRKNNGRNQNRAQTGQTQGRGRQAAPQSARVSRVMKVYALGPNAKDAVGDNLMKRIVDAIREGDNTQPKLIARFKDVKKSTVQHEICRAGPAWKNWIMVDEAATKKAQEQMTNSNNAATV